MDPRERAAIDQLLEDATERSERRRLSVFLASHLLLPGLFLLVVIGAALILLPRGPAFVVAAVAVFLFLGLTTMVLDRNKDLVGAIPVAANGAALLQALFYTIYIVGAVFVYVLRSPIVLSGIVGANLFGLLFWRFRHSYLQAAEEANA